MSKARSSDVEFSSDLPIWMVLIGSVLALVAFFVWILQDQPLSVASVPDNGLLVQLSPEASSAAQGDSTPESLTRTLVTTDLDAASPDATGVIENKVTTYPSSADETEDETASESVDRRVERTPEPSPESIPASIPEPSPESKTVAVPSTEQADSEQASAVLPASDEPAGDPSRLLPQIAGETVVQPPQEVEQADTSSTARQPLAESGDEIQTDASWSMSTPVHMEPQPEILLTTELTESSPEAVEPEIVEPVVVERDTVRETAEQNNIHGSESVPMVAIQEDAVSLEETSIVEAEKTEPPSADLGALRQLLAEAAAINQIETESAPELAERERREALDSLGELSEAIRFAPGSKVISEAMKSTLTRIERVLADYPETSISVIVAANESGEDRRDRLLSQERGRAVIAWLVNQGLSFSRFSLQASADEQMPADSNRVEIQARSES